MLWSRGDQIVGDLFGPAILSGQIKKNTPSELWRKSWTTNSRAGKKSYYPKQVKKFSSRQLHRPIPHTQWVSSNFRTPCVMNWLGWFEDFGGTKKKVKIKWHGWAGTRCAYQRKKGDWVSGTSRLSTLLF